MSAPPKQVPIPESLQDVNLNEDLENILIVSARIGDKSGDQTFCSFTSLVIAFLWCEDPVSVWFQHYVKENKINTSVIYQHRGIKPDSKREICDNIDQGFVPTRTLADIFSRSANTMLTNAKVIAKETGQGKDDLGAHHLMASFVFRNPISHKSDLERWGINEDNWRISFTELIQNEFGKEYKNWEEILKKYLPHGDKSEEENYAGKVLGAFQFDNDALMIVRNVEIQAASLTPNLLTSELLFYYLVESGSAELDVGKDCKTLYDAIYKDEMIQKKFLEIDFNVYEGFTMEQIKPFGEEGSRIDLGPGFKRVLDRARTNAIETTSRDIIGIRHLIASILIVDDSVAHDIIVNLGIPLIPLRRQLLEFFSRNWLNDDGGAWRLILIGSTPPTMTEFNSDQPTGDDTLNVTRFATALATVIAADRVKPPISIGIFGDWGSGKSFFMRLMQEQTDVVCSYTDIDPEGKRLFCKRVVPIVFNAWHYAETNLWASMVQTIFESLRNAISDEKKDEFFDEFQLTKQLREEAEEELKEVAIKKGKIEAEKKRIETLIERKKNEVENYSNKERAEILRNIFMEGLDVERVINTTISVFGEESVEGIKKNAEDLSELTTQLKLFQKNSKPILKWLSVNKIKKEAWITGIITLIITSLVIVFFWKDLVTAQKKVIAFITEIIVFISAIGLRINPIVRSIKKGLVSVITVQERIENGVTVEEKLLDDRKKQAESDLSRVEEEKKEIENRIIEIDKEIKRLELERQPTRRIARLIERRLEGKEYEKYLSIISTIREDFKLLSELLPKISSNELKDQDSATLVQPIDRIVLYIDDLDRCPSDKVVSVIEAIHLILAFPLFVVVVGVDIRWMSKSLQEHYPGHLDEHIRENDAEDQVMAFNVISASSLDYLEKIFQIPFWLPPMEEIASRNMLGGLIPPVLLESDQNLDEVEGTTGTPGGRGNISSSSNVTGSSSAVATPSNVVGGAEALNIEPYEREFLLNLSGAVGKSPRRLKRFVNTYRILKASCDALERETFVEDKGKKGTYKAAMTLLSITIAAPGCAINILRQLQHFKDEDDVSVLESYLDELKDPHIFEEVDYAKNALLTYKASYDNSMVYVKDLKYWCMRAARFSFRTGHI